ncbi:MAG: GTPase HflX [Candidatus Omnitrophota bacterium]
MSDNFYYTAQRERCLLVSVDLHQKNQWPVGDIARELVDLTRSTGAEVSNELTLSRKEPTPNLYLGRGKAEEIAAICQEKKIDTVVFNNDLSGTQQRNLEELLGVKTIDRTQLILDIFARHAHSPEGKMQVELAQLEYLLPRLAGKGIMLSRLGGGIGTRGPGEQKLEVDRRRIRSRIDKLRKEISLISKHRQLIRKKRRENALPTVALVGYTNAGKSTLLNALADARQPVRDSLFTTLDTVSKRLNLPDNQTAVLSDTVGFLYHLPHHLIEAFKATLEEVKEADLLLHVLDVSNPNFHRLNEAVFSVLAELGCAEKPLLTALNKIDRLEDRDWLALHRRDFPESVAISALLKENLPELVAQISRHFVLEIQTLEIELPLSRMDLVAMLHEEGRVENIEYTAKTIRIRAKVNSITVGKIRRKILKS